MFMFRLLLLVGLGWILGSLYRTQVLPGLAVLLLFAAIVALDLLIRIRQDKSKKEDKSAR